MYSRKDSSGKLKVMHVEGDPDNPVNKGTLCPKGAGILDMIESPNRLQFPEVREPGSNTWKRISWDEALTRITKRMKADRDQNFVAKNAAGVTVNRWNTVTGKHAPFNTLRYSVFFASYQSDAAPTA